MANTHSFEALLKERKFEEVDKATQAALVANPTNIDAMLGRIDLLLSLGADNRLEEAIQLSEQCVKAHPSRSECQEYLGNTLGTKAMRGGVMSAIGYASKIRDAFKKAVELDPKNIDARFSLLQFYQQAPGFMGGGKGHAIDLAAQTAQVNPEAGKLMQGSIQLSDKEYAKVEAAVQAPLPANQADLQPRQRALMTSLGNLYLQDKKLEDSLRLFSEIQKRFPTSEAGPYGVGRVLQEQHKHSEAVAQFEKALSIRASAALHYRLGQSLQSLNDKPKAIAAYEKALAFKPAMGKKMLEDAQDQLKSLKG